MNTALEIMLAFLALFYYILESLVMTFIPRSWKTKDVKDELVLITGGGSGIGRLLALRFSRLGCKVVIWDVNEEGNKETVNMIKQEGGTAYSYECDLTKREEIYKTAEKVKEELGKVTILINNAGIVTGKPVLECPDHMIQRTFDVNILAHFWTVKAFLPDMIMNDHGHIVTVASLGGMCGINRLSDYCASKFAAVGFDETLRMELRVDGRDNIHTTVICPYFINTGMFDGVNSKFLPILSPEDVANAIVSGVLTNERMVIIPRYCYMFMVLKMILPWNGFFAVGKAMGAENMMTDFRGRHKKEEQETK